MILLFRVDDATGENSTMVGFRMVMLLLMIVVIMMVIEVKAMLMMTSLMKNDNSDCWTTRVRCRHGAPQPLQRHLQVCTSCTSCTSSSSWSSSSPSTSFHNSGTCKSAPLLPYDHLHRHQLPSTKAPPASMHFLHLNYLMIIFIAINFLIRDNGESCWQVDEASLDHNHGQGNATIIEVLKHQ